MKTSFASQASADMIIDMLNDMKKNISAIKTDIESMKVRIR